MSNAADSPDRTIEEAVPAEDLTDLLAPGTPSAAPGSRAAPPPAPTPRAVPQAVTPRAVPQAVPLRVGSRFQPMPGPLPIATGDPVPGSGLVLVAAAGTPVHAVEAGTVTVPARAGEALRLVADSGLTFCYGGLAPGSVAVSSGTRVAAGAILGAVAATSLSAMPQVPPHLALRIMDEAGADLDVPGFLVGLPDPNELGHAAVGTGVDVDPDALDLEIVGASGDAAPSWRAAP